MVTLNFKRTGNYAVVRATATSIAAIAHAVCILVPIAFCGCRDRTPLTDEQASLFEMRLVHPENENLLTRSQGEWQGIEGYELKCSTDSVSPQVIVSKTPVIDLLDVHSAFVGEDDFGRIELHVKLTPDGREKLRKFTKDYVPLGRKNPSDTPYSIALLVNGRVVMMPKLVSVLDSSELAIPGLRKTDIGVILQHAQGPEARMAAFWKGFVWCWR